MKDKKINRLTLKQRVSEYKNDPLSLILLVAVLFAMVVTVLIVIILIAYILVKGIPHINADLFALEYTRENVSMMPAIINTITMTLLTVLLAVPIGVFSAIYLVEYAPRGSKFVKIIRITTETLAQVQAYATAVVLLVMVVIINILSGRIAKKISSV